MRILGVKLFLVNVKMECQCSSMSWWWR